MEEGCEHSPGREAEGGWLGVTGDQGRPSVMDKLHGKEGEEEGEEEEDGGGDTLVRE